MSFGKRSPFATTHPRASAGSSGATRPRPRVHAGRPGSVAPHIVRELCKLYENDGHVHIQTALSALGAVAGFSAQQAVWREFIGRRRVPQREALPDIVTRSGETYYSGDRLTWFLADPDGSEFSLWHFVSAAVLEAGSKVVPKLSRISERVAATLGTPEFGVPRLPDEHVPEELPRAALDRHWSWVQEALEGGNLDPALWPAELGMAACDLIARARREVSAPAAALIVMEAAIPMSQVDVRKVPGASTGLVR